MNTDSEKFGINLEGTIYQVERSKTEQNIYKLNGPHGSYLISKDFYGFWVEPASKSGAARISLADIGQQIEDHYNNVNSL